LHAPPGCTRQGPDWCVLIACTARLQTHALPGCTRMHCQAAHACTARLHTHALPQCTTGQGSTGRGMGAAAQATAPPTTCPAPFSVIRSGSGTQHVYDGHSGPCARGRQAGPPAAPPQRQTAPRACPRYTTTRRSRSRSAARFRRPASAPARRTRTQRHSSPAVWRLLQVTQLQPGSVCWQQCGASSQCGHFRNCCCRRSPARGCRHCPAQTVLASR
jgi:hypothetical protein